MYFCSNFERSTIFLVPAVRKILILGNFGDFGPRKRVSPIFQSNHEVNPENRFSDDSKIVAVSEFAITGRSLPFFDWSTSNYCKQTKRGKS